jgi:hypothetical protein
LQTPATLKIVIVEQSSLIAEKMREILFGFCPLEVPGNATCIPDAVDLIKHNRPPAIKRMILTNHIKASYQVLSEDLGVHYFLNKSHDFHKLPETLLEMFDLKTTAAS